MTHGQKVVAVGGIVLPFAAWLMGWGICVLLILRRHRRQAANVETHMRQGVSVYQAARVTGGLRAVDDVVLVHLHTLGLVHVSDKGIINPAHRESDAPLPHDPLLRAAAGFRTDGRGRERSYELHELSGYEPYTLARDAHAPPAYDRSRWGNAPRYLSYRMAMGTLAAWIVIFGAILFELDHSPSVPVVLVVVVFFASTPLSLLLAFVVAIVAHPTDHACDSFVAHCEELIEREKAEVGEELWHAVHDRTRGPSRTSSHRRGGGGGGASDDGCASCGGDGGCGGGSCGGCGGGD
ncbi:hypothetical protein [Embleya sp. NPDC020630]|uniref:hypothetical protein n=1 Tax=Embleya sp. NPDC020630 TaxID=3363979 RepID=UPI0037A49AD5